MCASSASARINSLENVDTETITNELSNQDKLTATLPGIAGQLDEIKQRISLIDADMKRKSESKKKWQQYTDALQSIILNAMCRHRITSISAEDVKARVTSRSVLKTDDALLLAEVENSPGYNVLRSTLPPYVSIELGISKTKLRKYLDDNPNLISEWSDRVQTRENFSLNISQAN